MHSYNGLFDNMLTNDAMTVAFMDASENKRDRDDVRKVLNNLDYHKDKLRNILVNEKFKIIKHTPCIINEANCHKEREIVKPYYKYEQVVHHLIVGQLKPIIMKGFYEYSCGSIPDRGCHFGKRNLERWIKKFPENTRIYVLKMDVRHFFENVDHDILKDKLSKVIRDKKFLRLLFQIIDAHEKGLPLGYYPSQWLANFYLKAFDHFVKEVLGAQFYMRYMDDMVILDTDKSRLHEMCKAIKEYLGVNLKLELKDNWQVFPLAVNSDDKNGRCLDFMGFKFYRNMTTLRKSILCRATRKANKIYKKSKTGKNVTWKDATSMISYMGWIDHTKTYQYYLDYIKPKVIIRSMKHKVSKHNRKENKYDRLETSSWYTIGKAVRGRFLFQYNYCVSA